MKNIDTIVGEFGENIKRNFGSLDHQVCNRNMTIDDMLEYILPLYQQALTTRENEIVEMIDNERVPIDEMKHDLQCKCDFTKNEIIQNIKSKIKNK